MARAPPDHDCHRGQRHDSRARASSTSARASSRTGRRCECQAVRAARSKTTASTTPSSGSTSPTSTGLPRHAQRAARAGRRREIDVRQRHPPLELDDITIADNRIAGHRDGIYFEFVRDSVDRGNVSERNLRYGLHFMYSDDCRYLRQHVPAQRLRRRRDVHEARRDDRQPLRGQLGRRGVRAAAQGDRRRRLERQRLLPEHRRACSPTAPIGIGAIGNEFIDNGWAVKLMASTHDGALHRQQLRRQHVRRRDEQQRGTDDVCAATTGTTTAATISTATASATCRTARCGSSRWSSRRTSPRSSCCAAVRASARLPPSACFPR